MTESLTLLVITVLPLILAHLSGTWVAKNFAVMGVLLVAAVFFQMLFGGYASHELCPALISPAR